MIAEGRCPECKGILYDIGNTLFCPSESCRPGGRVFRATPYTIEGSPAVPPARKNRSGIARSGPARAD